MRPSNLKEKISDKFSWCFILGIFSLLGPPPPVTIASKYPQLLCILLGVWWGWMLSGTPEIRNPNSGLTLPCRVRTRSGGRERSASRMTNPGPQPMYTCGWCTVKHGGTVCTPVFPVSYVSLDSRVRGSLHLRVFERFHRVLPRNICCAGGSCCHCEEVMSHLQ